MSAAALSASSIISKAGLVLISSSNTAPSLKTINGKPGSHWYPGYFRTSWNDAEMGRLAAIFTAKKLQLSKAALIHEGDFYTTSLTDSFADNFKELGGKIVLDLVIDPYGKNYKPILNAIARARPQVLYLPLGKPQESARFIRAIHKMDSLKGVVIIGGEGMISNIFLNRVGEAGIGIYLPGPASIKSDAKNKLHKAYKDKFGSYPPSFYYSFAHDAVALLFNAIKSSAIVNDDGALYISRSSLRNALYKTHKFKGLTGALTCTKFGDCSAINFNIFRLNHPESDIKSLRQNIVFTLKK